MEKFDFDIVKIDGRFIRKARESERGLKKLKNICDLIKNHDCKIIAEFIENEEDVLLALSYGIEYGQGYYFSKPVMLTDISAICEKINLLVTTNTDDEPLKVEQAG
jgi:EAL domain-containing protein (putative c-di-GMP-specific phosphodiesterase class I)